MLSGFHALSVDYFAGFTLEIEKIVSSQAIGDPQPHGTTLLC